MPRLPRLDVAPTGRPDALPTERSAMTTDFSRPRRAPRTIAWLMATLTAGAGFSITSGVTPAAAQTPHADARISVDHARPVSRRPARTESPTERELGGPTQPAPDVVPVGFLEDLGHRCGPVCDCDGGHGFVTGPTLRDFEHPVVGGYPEVSCGIEASCGLESCPTCRGEPVCGTEPLYAGEPVCGADRGMPCDCDACVSAYELDRLPLLLPVLRIDWCRFDLFAGVQGYASPMNFAATDPNDAPPRDGSGSFGFYQGFNESRSLRRWLGIDLAAQFGVRATQSNLSGAEFSPETRQQVFVTGGFFRRVDYGLQYGLVVDYLNEDWYYQADLTQLRGELSWRTRRCDEFGFHFMTGLGGEQSTTTLRDPDGVSFASTVSFEPTDQYRFFYRWRLRDEGSWTAFAGWSESDQGLLGTRIDLPLTKRAGLQTGFTYLIPDDGLAPVEHRNEAWNVSLGLVFRPGGPRRGGRRYSAPLMPVADNGTFVVAPR